MNRQRPGHRMDRYLAGIILFFAVAIGLFVWGMVTLLDTLF
jgi:hypothetical protein